MKDNSLTNPFEMKTINAFFISIILFGGVLLSGCETGPNQEDQTAVEELSARSDSLQQTYQELTAAMDTLQPAHSELEQQLQAMENVDTTLLADMGSHSTMMESIMANLQAEQDIFSAHEEFVKEYEGGEVTSEQVKAQIQAIRSDFDGIRNEQQQIRSQIDQINQTHQDVRQKIQEMAENPEQ